MKQHGAAQSEMTGGFANTVALNTGDVQNKSILSLPAGFRLAQTFTLEFGVLPPVSKAAPGTPGNYNPVASIQWVENGHQIQRIISVGNGATISGSGTGVQVGVSDVPLGDPALYENALPYQVTAVLSPGLRPSFTLPPILKDHITVVLASGPSGLTVLLPTNAGIKGVDLTVVDEATPGTIRNVYIEAQDFAANNLKTWSPYLSPGIQGLPPNTKQLRIINNDAIATIDASWAWIIDG